MSSQSCLRRKGKGPLAIPVRETGPRAGQVRGIPLLCHSSTPKPRLQATVGVRDPRALKVKVEGGDTQVAGGPDQASCIHQVPTRGSTELQDGARGQGSRTSLPNKSLCPEVLTQEAEMQLLGGQADVLSHWSAGPLTLRCVVTRYPFTKPLFPQPGSSGFL